jgi:hypothetical protein
VNGGPELTHGYTLPAGRYDRLPDLLEGLKLCRKYGWSQAKVDKIIAETFTP